MADTNLACLTCSGKACEYEPDNLPSACSAKSVDEALHKEVRQLYLDPENHRLMLSAAHVSEMCADLTRVQETIEFARSLGAHKLGIATCTALMHESHLLRQILERAGFEVHGIACKVESLHRADRDLPTDHVEGEGPVLCNPIMQARLLERAGTELNIVMGLCVGHDALFYKYSAAPTTTLVTRDFVTGNNPCAALYASKSVLRRRLDETIEAKG